MHYVIAPIGGLYHLQDKSVMWLKSVQEFEEKLREELECSDELILHVELDSPSEAVKVGVEGGVPVTSRGITTSDCAPAGLWIVDVENESRAIEISQKIIDELACRVELRRRMSRRVPDIAHGVW
jgi:hypothetical protein